MRATKKILLILAVVFILSFIAGKIADRGYHHFWSPFYDKLDVALEDSTYFDILYFGNSTVHFGINPYFVDSITKLSSYNLGYGGANIESIDMLLRGYLEKHNDPKAVLISLDYSSFWENGDFGNHFLYFEYLDNSAANQFLKDKGYKTAMVKYLPFLKYSYFDDYNRGTIIKGFKESPFTKDAFIFRGFINNKSNGLQMVQMNAPEFSEFHLPAKKHVDMFRNLIDFCKAKKIKVVLVFPPRIYLKPQLSPEIYITDTIMQNTGLHYGIPFRRFDSAGTFDQSEFSDNIHLNKNGSTRYSIILGNYIDSLIR